MLQSDLKRIIRLECCAAVLLAVFFVFIHFIPLLQKAVVTNRNIRVVRKPVKVLSADDKTARQQQLQRDFERLTEQFTLLKEMVRGMEPWAEQELNVPMVTLQIEDMAGQARVELVSLKPLPQEKGARYKILPIEIGLRSSYAQLTDFLTRIEAARFLMSVCRMTINKGSANSSVLDISLTVDILFTVSQEEKEG